MTKFAFATYTLSLAFQLGISAQTKAGGSNMISCTHLDEYPQLSDIQIHIAVTAGCKSIIERALKDGSAHKTLKDRRFHLLITAIQQKHDDIAYLLIQSGWPITESTADSNTLEAAVHTGNVRMTRYLLERGLDPNGLSRRDMSLLEVSVLYQQPEISRLLMKFGAKPVSALLYITEDIPLLEEFASHGLDLRTSGKSGENAVSMVIIDDFSLIGYPRNLSRTKETHQNMQLKKVRYLSQKGLDINQRDKDGMTPLKWARHYDNKPMIRFLETAGARE